MRSRWQWWSVAGLGLVVLSVAALSGVARAEIPEQVQKKLRGKILITEQELPENAGDVKATVKLYRKKDMSAVKHVQTEPTTSWDFYFLAFMKRKPRASQVSLDFYTADKEKLFVANKRFTGVDPSLKLLKGRIKISEDDGLKRGATYNVKLTAKVGRREVTLATTRLTTR